MFVFYLSNPNIANHCLFHHLKRPIISYYCKKVTEMGTKKYIIKNLIEKMIIKSRDSLKQLSRNTSSFITFLREEGIILKNKKCHKCRNLLNTYVGDTFEASSLCCKKRLCVKKRYPLKINSFLYDLRIPTSKILEIIYEFSKKTKLKKIIKETGLNKETGKK
ncbi:hypothetical protein SLOPH_568 [Spraguea lophii 42_110]|uniref:Uncharacterized protein n=1 Tax=Spraguea lophii (strain 42_110) TaxID=1358809 RepID=S7XG04_SPRLO|nr:hypothetical protein SLOPH_568 [Spraguea lophii 42_110]